MIFNINEFLAAVSFALDFVEMDILGVASNHSKRVACISSKIAESLKLSKEEIFDLVSLSLLHDNGASEKVLHSRLSGYRTDMLHSIENVRGHCIVGEKNIKDYPFLTPVENVIYYHHENYDGTGFFGKKGDDIPLMSQIIRLADAVELSFNLKDILTNNKQILADFVANQTGSLFSPRVADAFQEVSRPPGFWLELKDEYINSSLRGRIPVFKREMPYSSIHGITGVFSRIIDSKSEFTRSHSSELTHRVMEMAEYYKTPEDEMYKLMIAADLHDIGKLAVSNSILDKPGKLDIYEFESVIKHPFYTRVSLQKIKGFEDITEWASNHHEKLNGTGYPYMKTEAELDFNSRLIACLDIYQALKEERPYREAMSHVRAYAILEEMAAKGELDSTIVKDISKVFSC
ncbi:MAG: HD-GYP domain-containing protein [Clostridia bacterium]